MPFDTYAPWTRPSSPLWGALNVDLARRRDPATGAPAAVLAWTLSGCAEDKDDSSYPDDPDGQVGLDLLISESRQSDAYLDCSPAPAAAAATFTLDLGESRSLRVVGWRLYGDRPASVSVDVSADGSAWTTVVDARATIDGWNYLAFRPIVARHVRLRAASFSAASVKLGPISVHPSAIGPTIPVAADGLDAMALPGASLANITSGWVTQPEIPSWRFDSEVPWRGRSTAGDDLSFVKDIGRALDVTAIPLRFQQERLVYGYAWEGGIVVEHSIDGSAWTTLYESGADFEGKELAFAPTAMRYVRVTIPTGHGSGSLENFAIYGGGTAVRPEPAATATLEADGWISAGFHDATTGEQVAPPLLPIPARAGTHPIWWDGLGFDGATPVPAGSVEVRAAASTMGLSLVACTLASGAPGAQPQSAGWYPTDGTSVGANITGAARMPDGRLVLVTIGTEDSANPVLLDAAGAIAWSVPSDPVKDTFAVAAGTDHFWVARHPTSSTVTLERRRYTDGARLQETTLTTGISVVPDAPRTRQSDRETLLERSTHGLAATADGSTLFAADMVHGKLIALDGNDLATVIADPALEVVEPVGIALDPDGAHLWVAHGGEGSGNGVIGKYSFDPTTRVCDPTPVAEIAALDGPTHLSIATIDGTPHLAAVVASNGIRQWDISGIAPVAGGSFDGFGQAYAPGDYVPAAFGRISGMLLDADGTLWVGDEFGARTVHFAADGSVLSTTCRGYGHPARVWPGSIADESLELHCGELDLEVKLDGVPWTTAEGGIGDGLWRIARMWRPTDSRFFTGYAYQESQPVLYDIPGVGERRAIVAMPDPLGADPLALVVHIEEPGGIRRAAWLGSQWRGKDADQAVAIRGWSAVDLDGDGLLDYAGDGTTADGEVAEMTSGAVAELNFYGWEVDADGSIVLSLAYPAGFPGGSAPPGGSAAIVRIPIREWHDSGGGRWSPVYRWEDYELIRSGAGKAWAHQPKPMPGGDLIGRHQTSHGAASHLHVARVAGQDADRLDVAATAASGSQMFQALADPVEPDGYVWAAESSGDRHWWYRIDAATGAILGTSAPDAPANQYALGWADNNKGVDVVATPDGRILLISEANFRGATAIYEATGLDSALRASGTLAWPGSLEAWSGGGPSLDLYTPATGGVEEWPEPEPMADDLISALVQRARLIPALSDPLPGGIHADEATSSPTGAHAILSVSTQDDHPNAGGWHWSRATVRLLILARSPAEARRIGRAFEAHFRPEMEPLRWADGRSNYVRVGPRSPLERDRDDQHTYGGLRLHGQVAAITVVSTQSGR